ncbi:hypothetical protein DXG03_007258 [Asterophora parasitica]|uniref:HAD-like protein n=1 Tax=Asterophora parasitica TaxID=117018 RepID=A0A9P7FYR9_9AGAR|nr:hypothetical protein DXG03_007258 [Asterophora parasitica]
MATSNGESPVRPKIEYVLFDMDGLMIDSENVYTDVTNEILGQHGRQMTWDIKAGIMGKPEREAAEHLLSFFPDIPLTYESYLAQRNALQDAHWPKVLLLPGVRKLVQHLKTHNIPIAVATGSTRRNFELKTGHLGDVFDCFEGKVVCGDDEQYGMKGKPAPDIFLVAAREMLGKNVGDNSEACSAGQETERAKGLVFEDGIPGMQAGKRAGMSGPSRNCKSFQRPTFILIRLFVTVIWVPDSNLLDVYTGSEQADQIHRSIEDFVPEEWGLPPYTS